MKTKKLRCEACNGIMEIDSSKSIIFCPYCGSKELIEESDTVKTTKIIAESEIKKTEIIEKANIEKAKINSKAQNRKSISKLFESLNTLFLVLALIAAFIFMYWTSTLR